MSAAFSIERPTVVATLPRPVNHAAGRYVVSEVHGGTIGSRKRKRSELVVGVDGEGLSIYDTQSSKFVTSYAVPPQSSFTCAPCSVRLHAGEKNGIERRTYVSTSGTASNLILFRDSKSSAGITVATSQEKILQGEPEPVIYLTTIFELGKGSREDLLLVRKNGEIQCLDGIDLSTRWVSPASNIGQRMSLSTIVDHEVCFAQLTDAHRAKKTILKDREDILSLFPQESDAGGLNSHILVIITCPKDSVLASARTLHVVTLPLHTGGASTGTIKSVYTVLSVALPDIKPHKRNKAEYMLQVTSGLLYELDDQYLRAIDLSGSRPKTQSQLYLEDVNTFLPLSSTSLLTASNKSINIYNRKYQSIQASIHLESNLQSISKKRKIDDDSLPSVPKTCRLVSYSSKYGLAHAVFGNDLLAFRIDSRQDFSGRRQILGLLIDTLGHGIGNDPNLARKRLKKIPLASIGPYIPGSNPDFETEWNEKFSELDRFVSQEDITAFEMFVANELGIKIEKEKHKRMQVNGIAVIPNGTDGSSTKVTMSGAKPIPGWVWPESIEEYPEMDPRLVKYILSRIFSWRKPESPQSMESSKTLIGERLNITFFPPNLVQLLIETGNFTHNNVISALQFDGQVSSTESIPYGLVIDALADIDPELRTLFSMISKTYLDPVELIHAIRLLMQSLELLEDVPAVEEDLLTNGIGPQTTNGELEAEIELEHEEAETALTIAESYLGEHSSVRGQALSLALAKLHACPDSAVVLALRTMLTSAEIVSLIYLLRFELARGAWTSRYLDTHDSGSTDDEQLQEDTILLVSGLLNRCIDAIGAGGWLSGDSTLINGDHFESEELIQSLKLEVSAALEGIEEASYLKGLISEMVRYGENFQKGLPGSEKGVKTGSSKEQSSRPILIPLPGRDSRLLPFGLKSEQQVTRYRIGAGGEIQQRTARDIGHLKSKKVGKYSRERIVI